MDTDSSLKYELVRRSQKARWIAALGRDSDGRPQVNRSIPRLGWWKRLMLVGWSSTCRWCGCDEIFDWNRDGEIRPHWNVFCAKCGRRRSDIDGFSDRGG